MLVSHIPYPSQGTLRKLGLTFFCAVLSTQATTAARSSRPLPRPGQDPYTSPDDWLFDCLGGSQVLIKVIGRCERGCQDNGSGRSDRCA